jgi:gentisate 1,2-dioxygenase
VLRPGEETLPRRESTNQIEITIAGCGTVTVGEAFDVGLHDVWNLAPMRVYSHRNTGKDLWVRLTYSNETLLERLGVLFAEEGADIQCEEQGAEQLSAEQLTTYVREAAPDLALGTGGARLRGYEFLTDIEFVESRSLVWPWRDIEPHLPATAGDGRRAIWLMYNPATERRNGTSNCFFATWAGCAPGTPPLPPTRGHRHTSASINYHTAGSGRSVVDGAVVDWKAGDLLFSAPSWSEHTHYHGSDGWTILTVQDHPMHIALGSLLWQERMGGPIHSLGTERGQTGYTAPRAPGR